jgi:glycosyltransferase involved in cell wall biosynthesis
MCLQATASADIAYCVLPPRTDWRYAPPIKVGEALAGGTVPLLSDFPGNHQLAADAGEYVDPDENAITGRIDQLAGLSDAEFRAKGEAARARGEEVSWSKIRREFSRQIATTFSHCDTKSVLVYNR